jgi:hypothetical protein
MSMSRITDQEFKLSFSLVGERSSEWLDEATNHQPNLLIFLDRWYHDVY